jgi:hypothetical protein
MKKKNEILSEEHVNELLKGVEDYEESIMDKNIELAKKHWIYISELLDITLKKEIFSKEYVMAQCQFHYLTAWEHGSKHMAELMEQETKNV